MIKWWYVKLIYNSISNYSYNTRKNWYDCYGLYVFFFEPIQLSDFLSNLIAFSLISINIMIAGKSNQATSNLVHFSTTEWIVLGLLTIFFK